MFRSSTARSFSLDVVTRMLEVLREKGPLKKTNLATSAGLNYGTCIKYMTMLRTIGWIETKPDTSDLVFITSTGREQCDRLRRSSLRDQVKQELVSAHRSTYEEAISSESDMLGKSHRQIMLVDDEPDVLRIFESFLAKRGYGTCAFTDSYDALREFAKRPSYFDLIILDIRMPDLNGLQLYQSLKAMDPRCRVIFVSALDALDEIKSVLPVIPDQIMRKPIDKASFLRTIELILC